MEDDHPSSRVPSWVRYEFKDGVPQGDLPPPERLRRVLWDRTAYNRGQLVKLARIHFRLNYKHDIDRDTLAHEVHVYCSNWEKQNPGWQTWWSGRSTWGKGLSHRMVGVTTFPLAASAKPARPLAAVISGSISHELRAQVFEMSHGRAVRFT